MHLFYVANKLVKAFLVGYPSESDPNDFFLAGDTLFDAPVVWCRLYDPQGNFLVGLERNKLVPESQGKYKQVSLHTRPGWCLQDNGGKSVFTIETVTNDEARKVVHSLAKLLGKEDEMAQIALGELAPKVDKVTRIYGEFYDKQGRLAARGDEAGLSLNCPVIFDQSK